MILVLWGLTPLQSGMFATQSIVRIAEVATVSSKSYLSLQDQKTTLTGSYAQSVYNIAWLNESLQPFMSRQGMLAPFSLAQEPETIEMSETWTAPTRFYSVDVDCEVPTYDEDDLISSAGCKYDIGNMIIPSSTKDDQYNSLYVGYWYEESMDSYLRGDCPEEASQTFLVRWSRGRRKLKDSTNSPYPLEGTTLWCKPSYCTFGHLTRLPSYRRANNAPPDQQDVNATVAAQNHSVLEVHPIGPKRPLPTDLVNVTDLEWSMSQGYELNNNRGEYPTSSE